MAELAGRALRAAVELAADQDRAADAGAERQHQRDALAARGAVAVLREQREIGVVVDERGQADALGHHLGERQAGDRQVHRGRRETALVVDQAGDPEADRLDLAADRVADLGDRRR